METSMEVTIAFNKKLNRIEDICEMVKCIHDLKKNRFEIRIYIKAEAGEFWITPIKKFNPVRFTEFIEELVWRSRGADMVATGIVMILGTNNIKRKAFL